MTTMARKAIVALLALVGVLCVGRCQAQTYYYERVAVVNNGVKTAASGDGHFITFTPKGCYDSDKDGISENTGFRAYQTTANNILNYYGDSYFGCAYYYFSTDRQRLNIKCENGGSVYVYERRNAPAGVTKSQRRRGSTAGSSTTIVAPQPAIGTYNTPSTPSSSASSTSSQSRYGYYTCPTCYGSGKCPTCHGTHLRTSTYTGETRICMQCNNKGQCPSCNGSGKKYGVIR